MSGAALLDLLANLIEKYAAVLDIDNLPEPPNCLGKETAGATKYSRTDR